MNEAEYKKLKEAVEEARSESDKAQGALSELMRRLKEEFDCTSLKEARAQLEKLEAKKEEAETAFEKALKAYETKWKAVKEEEEEE